MLETWYISRQQDKENPYLFPGAKPNSHMTTRAVQKIVSKYADRTKLNLTPHVMRPTFAKQLLDSGVSLDKVSAILGHARLDTTAIYTKCTQEELNEQTEKIARLALFITTEYDNILLQNMINYNQRFC